MNAIDPTKTYRTADGRSVRILATDLPGPWPVAILVEGDSLVTQLTPRGQKSNHYKEAAPFIIEEKPRIKKELWINLYAGGNWGTSATEEESRRHAGKDVFARRKIILDCEMGEGLE